DSDRYLRPEIESRAASVHQPELLHIPQSDRPERTYYSASYLWTGLLQRRPGTVQELRYPGAHEAAVSLQRLQLHESPAVIIDRGQPQSRLQRDNRLDLASALRYPSAHA